ncbi:hypothetical protein CR513_36520, partial [Mucuna pruriens]
MSDSGAGCPLKDGQYRPVTMESACPMDRPVGRTGFECFGDACVVRGAWQLRRVASSLSSTDFSSLFLLLIVAFIFALVLHSWTQYDFLLLRKSSFCLGPKLTLAYLVASDPSEDATGSSFQGNQSPGKAASEAGSPILWGQSSSSLSDSTEVFPFEIWYHNNTKDNLSDDPYMWVDPNVKKVLTTLMRASILLGTTKAICQHGPWSVIVCPCRPTERTNTKVGWTSLSSQPKRKLLKPFLESFKVFEDRYFQGGCGATGPNILADNSGDPFFPLYWTSQPAVSVTVIEKDMEKWESEFIEELNDLPILSCAEIIKGAGYFAQYLKNLKRKTSQADDAEIEAQGAPIPAES